MALSLLQKVAEKALNTASSFAGNALNYLQKNPTEAFRAASNPTMYVATSKPAQDLYAGFGRLLQKTPDTTIKAPERPKFIKTGNEVADFALNNPVGRIEDKVGEFVTGIPGEFARSWGRTIERVNTEEGRKKIVEGAKQLPGQVKKIATQPGHRMEGLGELVENPALEDALNATDLFTLGAGTALKAAGKESVEAGVKQVVKKGTKEVIEQGAKTAAKTAAKEVVEEGAETAAKSTAKTLFKEIAEKPGAVMQTVTDPKAQKAALNVVENTNPNIITEGAQAAAKKTADFFQKPVDIAKRWISTREGFTNWRAADIKKTPGLTAFDNQGMDAILELQAGKNPEKFKAIKDFTDGLFELEKKAGLLEPENYRKNYLPQLWDNTPEQIEAVFKKTVGKKAGFTKARLLEDYKTGIEAGLTPRYNTVSDLLESRFKSSQRALADKEFVDNLWKSGNAKTLDKAPPGWKTVDLKYEGKPIAVPPEVAKLVQTYTGEGSALLEKTAQFVSEAKQTILSAGIPKTGWNFHTGVNVPVRRVAASKNPFSAVIDSVIWNSNPKSAQHYIDNVVPKDVTDNLLKAGLNISRTAGDSGYGFKPKAGEGVISKARTTFDKLFSEAAFDKVLPAHKLKVAWETYQNAIKKGVQSDEAYRIAADTANTIFGGVNPDTLGRSKDFQNVLRTFLLAPDWLESNINIARRTGGLLNPKNWADPAYAPYKRFAVNAAGMYTSFAMLNKAMSGHWPWENGAGQEFNLATGSYDERGRERMIPAFGTAFDFVRIPLQLVQGAAAGSTEDLFRPVRNRLSPPASAFTSLFLTGEDYRGNEIDTPGEIAGQVAQAVGVPSQITNIIGGLTGEQTPEQVAAGLLEFPIRYRGGARNAEDRQTAELMKSGGATNEQINQAMDNSGNYQDDGGWFGNLFGGQKSGANIKLPKTPKEKKNFEKSVDTALQNGANDLPEDVIITRFFDGKTYDKSARSGQQDILDSALKIADDEYLTPEQKASIINAAKIDGADLEYYRAASMDQTDRLEGLLMYAGTFEGNRDDFLTELMLGKRQVGGKSMFSTSMYDRLYDEGYITKEEKALIAAVKYDPVFNKFYMDRDYKGGGGGGGATASKVRSYISSVNALHKSPFKKISAPKTSDVIKNTEPMEAPKLNLPSTSKGGGRTQNRWFTAY